MHRIPIYPTDFGEICFTLRVDEADPTKTQMFFLDRVQAEWFARDLALVAWSLWSGMKLPRNKAEEQACLKAALELVADLDHKE
jgi:hypothetical protein